MIENYKENLFADIMSKAGISELANKNISVVVKQDFIVSESTILKAGTLGYIKKVKGYEIRCAKAHTQISLTMSTPNSGDIRLCSKIYDVSSSLDVEGLKDSVAFNDLFEIVDEETGDLLEKRYSLQDDYNNKRWAYERKNSYIALVCFIIAVVSFLTGLVLCFLNEFVLARMIAAIVSTITLIYGHYFMYHTFDKTKKGREMTAEIETLTNEIAKRDEISCLKYAENKECNN